MSRLIAVLALVVVLAVPAAAAAQGTTIRAPLLAYQSDDQRLSLTVGAWLGRGKWLFTGPVDAQADNRLFALNARYRLTEPWALAFAYAGGSWNNITFNGEPAPATVSGNVSLASFDLRYRMGPGPVLADLIFGYQYYRARTEDSALTSSDEARAGGFRFGAEAWIPLSGPLSARVSLAFAPSMSVTETFISGETTTTRYNGSLTDLQLALRYDTERKLIAEAGYRAYRIDFRRPTDVLEHTLTGFFLQLIYRP